MLKILLRLYKWLMDYLHPSLELGAREVGIWEDMRCSTEELEALKKLIKDFEDKRC